MLSQKQLNKLAYQDPDTNHDVTDLNQDMVKEIGDMLQDTMDSYWPTYEAYGDDDCRNIEFQHRDGFAPSSWNMGGKTCFRFMPLDRLWDDSYCPSSKSAQKALNALFNDVEAIAHNEQEDVIEGRADAYYSEDSIDYSAEWLYMGTRKNIHYARVCIGISLDPYRIADTDWQEIIITWRKDSVCLKKTKAALKKLADRMLGNQINK